MHQDISVLRSQIAEFLQSRRSSHVRYPSELKAWILEYARFQQRQKISKAEIAADLGLALTTLKNWLYAEQPKAKVKPVVVSSTSHRISSVVLITRHGHRVEGLDVDGMAQLLRGLS